MCIRTLCVLSMHRCVAGTVWPLPLRASQVPPDSPARKEFEEAFRAQMAAELGGSGVPLQAIEIHWYDHVVLRR